MIYEPAEWVSGDLYDVRRLDEQHIGFYIADAVGHSMPAALLTMFLKQAICMRETHGNQYRIHSPLEVIREANQRMAEQHLKGCLFATCCYGLLNAPHDAAFLHAGGASVPGADPAGPTAAADSKAAEGCWGCSRRRTSSKSRCN